MHPIPTTSNLQRMKQATCSTSFLLPRPHPAAPLLSGPGLGLSDKAVASSTRPRPLHHSCQALYAPYCLLLTHRPHWKGGFSTFAPEATLVNALRPRISIALWGSPVGLPQRSSPACPFSARLLLPARPRTAVACPTPAPPCASAVHSCSPRFLLHLPLPPALPPALRPALPSAILHTGAPCLNLPASAWAPLPPNTSAKPLQTCLLAPPTWLVVLRAFECPSCGVALCSLIVPSKDCLAVCLCQDLPACNSKPTCLTRSWPDCPLTLHSTCA